ncbi:MAG: amidohydrolase, partial [Lachnospiraceae bacterium]|nr:amidohydrolase [Lachnospiraceae bacterium]
MKADMILYSNAIFDSVGNKPFSGGIAIEGKKIVAVGNREEIKKYETPDTVVKDFGEKLIMPGFIDSHGHYSSGAAYFGEEALHDMEQFTSEEECAKAIGEFAKAHPKLKLIKGQGWYLSRWGENPSFPTAASIDKYVSDRPVYMIASDLHSVWFNTLAMEESGLKEAMKDLRDDYVLKDENGNPTGVVREAGRVVTDKLLEKYALTPEEADKKDDDDQTGLMHALNEQGITGFSDVSFVLPDDLKETYKHMKKIDDADEMTIRLYIYPGTDFKPELIKDIVPYEDYYSSDEMHIAGVKNILDGVTATFTAAMLEPYADNPDEKGVPATTAENIEAWVKEANKYKYGCRIHCIGDRAVRMALDAYEKSGKTNDMEGIRNAIEHIEMINPDDIPRFGKLNVIASMQPRHQILDRGEKLYRCGLERAKYEWAFKSIYDGGGRIAIGTDYPVVSYNTYENIYMGVTKRDLDGTQYGTLSPKEKLTLAQTIKGYTAEAAFINSMEDKVGT